jgi:lantibiotic modifying enzyme
LCLLYALGAGDIHFENLLASGEYPVLIDAETLLQPEMPYRSLPGYPEPAKKERSVIDTAMLPFFDRDRKQPYLYSALTASPENITPVLADAWKYPNTDRMVYQQEQIKLPAGNNLPTLEGATANFRIEPLEYLEQVLDGFREMYLFLLEKKDLLLGDESPLEVLAVQPMRFLFRNTRVYGVLLKKLYEPQFLRNGLDRSLELEALARAFVLEESCPPFWSILKAEQEAMEKLDVPFFYTGSSETGLNLPGGEKIKGWFEKSGYQVMRSNLEKLEMQDMERQLLTIREETEAYRKALLL